MEFLKEILNFVSDFGLPTVLCLLMWWQNKTTIEGNTKALNTLCDKFDEWRYNNDDLK